MMSGWALYKYGDPDTWAWECRRRWPYELTGLSRGNIPGHVSRLGRAGSLEAIEEGQRV